MSDWHAFLRTIATHGIQRGEIDADELVTTIIAALEGAIMLISLYDDPGRADAVAAAVTRHVATVAIGGGA